MGKRGPERLLPEEHSGKSERRPGENGTGEPEIQSAACNHFAHALRGAFLQYNVYPRVTLVEIRKEAAEKVLSGWPNVAETQLAFLALGGALNPTDELIDAVKKQPGLAEEDGTCGRECNGTFSALEESDFELILQGFDRAAQSWLGNMEPARGAREIQLLGHGLKIAQLAQVHLGRVMPNRHYSHRKMAFPFLL